MINFIYGYLKPIVNFINQQIGGIPLFTLFKNETIRLKSFFNEFIWFLPVFLPLSFIVCSMFDFILVDVVIPGHFAALDTAIPKELAAVLEVNAEEYNQTGNFETTPEGVKKNKYIFLLTSVVTFTLSAFYFSC